MSPHWSFGFPSKWRRKATLIRDWWSKRRFFVTRRQSNDRCCHPSRLLSLSLCPHFFQSNKVVARLTSALGNWDAKDKKKLVRLFLSLFLLSSLTSFAEGILLFWKKKCSLLLYSFALKFLLKNINYFKFVLFSCGFLQYFLIITFAYYWFLLSKS